MGYIRSFQFDGMPARRVPIGICKNCGCETFDPLADRCGICAEAEAEEARIFVDRAIVKHTLCTDPERCECAICHDIVERGHCKCKEGR